MIIIINHNGDDVITDKMKVMETVKQLFERGYVIYQNVGTREQMDLRVIDKNNITGELNLVAIRPVVGG